MDQAGLRANAAKIESEAELERLTNARNAEIEFLQKKNALETEKAEKDAEIEINKFKVKFLFGYDIITLNYGEQFEF